MSESKDEFARKFNEDATLNSTFAPPFHGDAGLSACDWWAGHARSPNAETTEDVPVGGAHDLLASGSPSRTGRGGRARRSAAWVSMLLFLAGRDADAGVFEEEKENVAAVVAAAGALAKGEGRGRLRVKGGGRARAAR